MTALQSLLHELRAIESTRRDLRNFAWVIAGFCAGVGAYILLQKPGSTTWPYWLGPAAGVALVGLLAPKLLTPFQKLWMALAVVVGFFMSRLILGAVFFALMTPLGRLMRLTGRDPMYRKLDRQATTYWNPRPDADKHRGSFYEQQY